MSALNYLVAAVIAGGATAATYDDMKALYHEAHAMVLHIEAQRDAQTEQLARVAWAADRKPGNPTTQELVDAGYLAPSYLTREKVGEPMALPAEVGGEQ